MSLAVACPVAAGKVDSPHPTTTLAGNVNEGPVVSATVIVWKPLLVLPQASVAVHVRVMVPVPLQPASAPASEDVTIGVVPESSVAVARPVAAGLVGSPHGTVASGGMLNTGGVESTTTVVVALAVQAAALVTVTVYAPAFEALADGIVGF